MRSGGLGGDPGGDEGGELGGDLLQGRGVAADLGEEERPFDRGEDERGEFLGLVLGDAPVAQVHGDQIDPALVAVGADRADLVAVGGDLQGDGGQRAAVAEVRLQQDRAELDLWTEATSAE